MKQDHALLNFHVIIGNAYPLVRDLRRLEWKITEKLAPVPSLAQTPPFQSSSGPECVQVAVRLQLPLELSTMVVFTLFLAASPPPPASLPQSPSVLPPG